MNRPFPERDDLLATVRDFLLELRPLLEGERRYQAQVAAYLLDIVRREGHQPARDGAIGDLETFRAAIRAGRLDDREAELAETLLTELIAEVRIVRPDQLDPMHRKEHR